MTRGCICDRETDVYMPTIFTVLRLSFHFLFQPVTNPTYIWVMVKAFPRSFSGKEKT